MKPVLSLFAILIANITFAAPSPIASLAYHPNGKLLAAGGHGDAAIVDADKATLISRLTGQTGRVTALAFSRDGKTLAIASGEPGKSGVVRLHSVSEKEPKFDLVGEIAGPKDVQYGLDFSPDHKLLAIAGYDRVIRICEVSTRKVLLELKDHSDTVYAVAFSPDGKLLTSASADRTVKIWDAESGKRLHTLGEPTDWVYSLAWHPDSKRVAAAGADKSLRVWEADRGSAKLVLSAFAHTEPVVKLAYSKDGQSIFTISEGKGIKKWDASKLVEQLVFPPQGETLLSLAVRPDGKQLAVGRFDGVLQLLDAQTGKLIGQPLPEKPLPPAAGRLEPNFGQRGQTHRVSLMGANLTADMSVSAGTPGVTAKLLGSDASKLQVEIVVDKIAPAGPATLTFKNSAGTTSVNFIVDRYAAIADAESIDSARKGRPVSLPTTIAGALDRAGQADYFRFEAKVGQEIGAQIVTAAIGSKLEPILEIADAEGRVLAEGSNGLIAFTCPKAGTYAIGVHDKDFRGDKTMFYRLHIGDVPVVSSVFPLGVQRGKQTNVQLIGANLPRKDVTLNVPADATIGTKMTVPFPADLEQPLGTATVVVGELSELDVRENSAMLAVPGTANGILAKPGGQHSLRFTAKKGQRLVIETNARRIGSPLDSFIEILDAKSKPVERATLRATARTVVVFRDHDSAAGGIRIETWSDLAMDDYVYLGNELLRIKQLPLNPDADCSFYVVDGQRVGFLDTTPGHHPAGEPIYKVELHPPGASFSPNGLPVIRLNYRNDDGGPGFGKDSRLFFDPPADGEYIVRIGDSRNEGGPNFGYRLTIREPKPDFSVRFDPTMPNVWKGGSIPINVVSTRIDGFDGPISLRFENLPHGFESPGTQIDAGQQSTTMSLFAGPLAKESILPLKLIATAKINGKEVTREVTGGPPKLIEPGDIVTTVSASELAIRPGHEAKILVKIERRNGFKGRIPIEVRGLPHGVRVLDIGLNGILITERDTEREVVVYAEPFVKPMEIPFIVLAKREGKNTEHGAKSVLLKVR